MEALILVVIPLLMYIFIKVALWRDKDVLQEEKAQYKYGEYLIETGRTTMAFDYFSQIIQEKGRFIPVAYLQRAVCQYRLGNYFSCIYDCQTALKWTNDLPELHLLMAKALWHIEDMHEALVQINKALWYYKDTEPTAYKWRALILRKMGRLQESQNDMDRFYSHHTTKDNTREIQ